ncbi:MAG TPA: DegT/DnrJ/EryC1/StrS family aminotransferase [Armatimonadota bacterium]|nr:DegT/DnrJ/EryC1/StrS family aminotransferase [Armatimonadota bacterium]
MRETFLPFCPPNLGEEEIDEVVATLREGWISTGPRTKAFERQFGEYVNAPGGTCLMLNSCTAGLHLSLVALGVGPGDEVVVPTMTFVASANVVEHVGARPVLVDVLPDTLCIDPAAVARAITERTRAIMPVHYAGHPAELHALDALAQKHNIPIVEDAAHAVPAWYRDPTNREVMIGCRNNLAAFSFYATKNLTTAEGGALTGPAELIAKARTLSLHGMSRDAWRRFDRGGSWRYDVEAPGFKYNMTDIQAAIGKQQLLKLKRFHARRREVVQAYNEAFGRHPALEIPVERENCRSSWHLYVLRIRPNAVEINRDQFIERLTALNIGTSVHFIPVHMMSFYTRKYGYRPEDLPVAADAATRNISLPLHPGLTDEDIHDVTSAVLEIANSG